MPQPTQSDVHVDQVLTQLSVAYIQRADHFVASQVFPNVTVQKQTDKYRIWTKADWFRDEAERRADSTESAGSGYTTSTTTYSCDVFALHKDIGDQTRANADNDIELESGATEFLTQRMMLRQEKQWVTDYFATSIWDTDKTGGTDFTKWSDYTGSDPIEDIEAGKQTILTNTGFLPNKLTVGYSVWRKLKHHPDILDRIKGAGGPDNPALVTRNHVAQVFELEQVLVAMAINNTAVEGETAVYAFTHGKHALLTYSPPRASLLTPSAGYTFQWQGVSEGLGENIGISRFRIQEKKTDRVEAEVAFDDKVVAADLGYFFSDAVA